jgi:peptidoglycan/LPS O-acetylase OafA/YrhL
MRNPLLTNIRKGIILGGVTAILFCLWISFIYAVEGSRPFTEKGITYLGTIATYLGMGIISGAIVGLLLPIARNTIGSYAVGFVGALPIACGIVIQHSGLPSHWDVETQTLVPVLVIVGGIAIGNEINKRRSKSQPNTPTPNWDGEFPEISSE